jgi:glycosyl hydrolase family 25
VVLFGVDVHPHFQAGLNIEQVHAEGFDFIAVKLSESTTTYPGLDWLRRAEACGMIAIGYHYLRPGNEDGQARVFCQQLAAAGNVPGMLDAEALADDGRTPTLTVSGIRNFLAACKERGAHVPLLYLPRWYHERMGSPDLSGLPMLWASSYVNGSGFASGLYEAVKSAHWTAYGGLPVGILQFTDKARVAGQSIDADAFFGTRDQLADMLGTGSDEMSAEIEQMIREIHHESTLRLPSRRGDDASLDLPDDTVLGHAADAAALAWRSEQRLIALQSTVAALQAAISTLTAAVSVDKDLDPDEFKVILDDALARAIIKVDVTGVVEPKG